MLLFENFVSSNSFQISSTKKYIENGESEYWEIFKILKYKSI